MSELVSQTTFESLKQIKEGQEIWLGRDLQIALGYKQWQKFRTVIASVMGEIEFETGDFSRSGKFFSEATNSKPRENAELTRLACYKIAMRGETPQCVQARTYFATQTRKQEIQSQNNPGLANLSGTQLLQLGEVLLNAAKNHEQRILNLETRIEEVATQKATLNVIQVKTAKDFKTLKAEKKTEIGAEINQLIAEKYIFPYHTEEELKLIS